MWNWWLDLIVSHPYTANWVQSLAAIILLFLMVQCPVIHPYIFGWAILDNGVTLCKLWIFRNRLREKGRCLSLAQFHFQSQMISPGTLILHSYSLDGMPRYFLWWTEDDLEAVLPANLDSHQKRSAALFAEGKWHDFDRWIWKTYLHPEFGRAYLLRIFNSRKIGKEVALENFDVGWIETCSKAAKTKSRYFCFRNVLCGRSS